MLTIYNSLSRKIEEFKPIDPPCVGMYTCGPTVYAFAHIGNFRTYTTADFLLRILTYNGYDVKYIMNLTDVGHLTGDNFGDADLGEDRMEKSAQKEGKTVWEVAEFYTAVFIEDYEKLGLVKPELFAKATDHIKEQITLVSQLELKGFTYQTSDGIYFDTSKDRNYGRLSNLDQIKEGARVEVNPEKKNPRDFALWKFSPDPSTSGQKRQMEWDSPWGVGFPGWHIECSAMALKYLTETFDAFDKRSVDGKKNYTIDIHTGGADLRETHHPNEIAQSEAATGKQFANYWVHVAFILVNGEKMSKSKGNLYRLYDLEKEGYDPLALRYLYMQTHYRQEMNFTLAALDASQNALLHLRDTISEWDDPNIGCAEYEGRFMESINNDLNMPEALSIVWDMVKSDYPTSAKAASLFKIDRVLGLNLAGWKNENKKITIDQLPSDVRELITERITLRKNRQYTKADHLRNKIKKLGYDILDTEKGIQIKKI